MIWLTGLGLGLLLVWLLAPTLCRLMGGWLWLRADRGLRRADERFDREYRVLVESSRNSLEAPLNKRFG